MVLSRSLSCSFVSGGFVSVVVLSSWGDHSVFVLNPVVLRLEVWGPFFGGGHFESMLVFHISLVALSLFLVGFLVLRCCGNLYFFVWFVFFFWTPFDISVTSVLRTGLDVFFSPCVNRYKKNYNNQDSFF